LLHRSLSSVLVSVCGWASSLFGLGGMEKVRGAVSAVAGWCRSLCCFGSIAESRLRGLGLLFGAARSGLGQVVRLAGSVGVLFVGMVAALWLVFVSYGVLSGAFDSAASEVIM
jgi:hypothetical protein